MKTGCFRCLALVIAVWCTDAEAAVAPPDTASPLDVSGTSYDVYVGDSLIYDSNVFRLPSGFDVATTVAPNAKRADVTDSITLGADGQWVYGGQDIELKVRGDENRFFHNSELNNFSSYDSLLWNWSIGSLLTGQLGAQYYQSLVSYGDTLYFGRDLLHSWDTFASASYELGPHWSLLGGIRETDSTHTLQVAQVNNLRLLDGNAGVQYTFGPGTTLAVTYDYADGTFPIGYELDNVLFDRSYTENRTRLVLHYTLSEKTLFDVSAGYVKRTYKNETIGAFSGGIGRASMQWEPTEKTQLTVGGWRDLEANLSAESDYFVSTGGNISPSWVASEKIKVSLAGIFERQNYIGSSSSDLLFGTRHDRIVTEQASLTYQPLKALRIIPSLNFIQRSSTQEIFAYDDKLLRVDVTFTF